MSVEETVRNIVIKIVHVPESAFTPTSTFKEMNADSLDVVQILVAVEEALDIEMEDEELENLTNMGEFIAYIERKVAEKG